MSKTQAELKTPSKQTVKNEDELEDKAALAARQNTARDAEREDRAKQKAERKAKWKAERKAKWYAEWKAEREVTERKAEKMKAKYEAMQKRIKNLNEKTCDIINSNSDFMEREKYFAHVVNAAMIAYDEVYG
jgi:membrane protein involved in colicin uptake